MRIEVVWVRRKFGMLGKERVYDCWSLMNGKERDGNEVGKVERNNGKRLWNRVKLFWNLNVNKVLLKGIVKNFKMKNIFI